MQHPQSGTCDSSKYRCNFPTEYVLSFEKPPRFRLLWGRLWGVCNTSLQLGTCDPSKYRCNSPTGYVRPFKKLSRFRSLRGRLWGVSHTPLQSGTCDPSKYRCDPPTGYVRGFKKRICIRHRRWRLVGVFDTPLQSGTCDPSKYRCNSSTRYVLPFKKLSCFRPLRGRGVGRIRYASTTGYVQSFKIPMLFPNRIRIVLLKNCPVFISFGAVCGAYSIRPYNWIRAILRNTDAILQLGTCEGSKNGSVYATVGGVWWGVCNTSLRLGMCGPSKNCPVFVPLGAVCGAYAIRPYDWVRVMLRNTDAIL